jgi:[ribosomal protein S5]-alanine N-acetyltransferase
LILETTRLRLREFAEDDWGRVLAYQSDPLYLRYYHWTERSEEDVKAFVIMFLDAQKEQPRTKFQLAVTLKTNDLLIGNCGIRINNSVLREANIGYELDSRFWGRGYATEAAQAILQFGFGELGMHRIWANTLAINKGSANVLSKLGMRLEGRELEKEYIKGQWHDSLTYAILHWEWNTN